MLVVEVARAFEQAGVRYGIVGGYAVALHGAVRGTVDLDLVLELDRANYEAAHYQPSQRRLAVFQSRSWTRVSSSR